MVIKVDKMEWFEDRVNILKLFVFVIFITLVSRLFFLRTRLIKVLMLSTRYIERKTTKKKSEESKERY